MNIRSLALRASVVSSLFLVAAPNALALPLLRPIILPQSSSSVSSDSSVGATSSSSSVIRPLQKLLLPPPGGSSSSVSSASSLKIPKPLPKNDLLEYCKGIKLLLQKGSSMTSVDSTVVDQFSLSIDMLTKANALCESMLSTLGVSSSSSTAASADSSCVKSGTQKVGEITLCKYLCDGKVKVGKCW